MQSTTLSGNGKSLPCRLAAPNEREQQLTPKHDRSIRCACPKTTATPTRPRPRAFLWRTLHQLRHPLVGERFKRTDHRLHSAARRRTSLEIVGESQITVRVDRAPATAEFTVRAVGDHRLNGRILSDRTWLTISPERLDSSLSEQKITLTIDPEGLTRSRAVALCTVIADRGARKSVTVVAERRGIKPQWLAAAIVALGAGTAAWPSISAKILHHRRRRHRRAHHGPGRAPFR